MIQIYNVNKAVFFGPVFFCSAIYPPVGSIAGKNKNKGKGALGGQSAMLSAFLFTVLT